MIDGTKVQDLAAGGSVLFVQQKDLGMNVGNYSNLVPVNPFIPLPLKEVILKKIEKKQCGFKQSCT